MPGSSAYASAAVDEANNGALAAASAAPLASAMSGCSGTLSGSDVAASNAGLINGTSTPEPTTNKPAGWSSSSSAAETSPTSLATAWSSSSGRSSRCTSAIEPSVVSTTANVAESGSMYSSAVRA